MLRGILKTIVSPTFLSSLDLQEATNVVKPSENWNLKLWFAVSLTLQFLHLNSLSFGYICFTSQGLSLVPTLTPQSFTCCYTETFPSSVCVCHTSWEVAWLDCRTILGMKIVKDVSSPITPVCLSGYQNIK